MTGIISILVVALVLGGGTLAYVTLKGRVKGSGGGRPRSRDAVIRDAGKKLAQNPRDHEALLAIGDVYYLDQTWDLAYKTYETLTGLTSAHPTMDEFLIHLRCGLSALKLNMLNEAHRSLTTAKAIKNDDFEVNYNLGMLEFQRKVFDKAVQYYQQARQKDPENVPALRGLGHSLFKLKKYKDAMNFIRKAIELAPDDKESFFTLAECYYEANQSEQALKIVSRLRADPVMGPEACLMSGTINMNSHQDQKAVEDFEIGLKHATIKTETLLDLEYRLATVYIKLQEIGKAIGLLRDVQNTNPNYKDAAALINRYQELNANKNLQIYMMAPQNDFIALCRKVVLGYYVKAKVKITNISMHKNEWADLLAEIDTPKWSDIVMFRFIRSQGAAGELVVRDFHSHLKEVKAGKGICITVGLFSDEARRYTEARLIDLIDKSKLSAILNTIDASPKPKPAAPGGARPVPGKPAASH
jgi:tetratricopeptide (TPR) repeat protein